MKIDPRIFWVPTKSKIFLAKKKIIENLFASYQNI